MAKKSQIVRSQKTPKFSTRHVNRCAVTGRSRGYMRKFGVSRIVFREMASRGQLLGVTKSSF